MRQLFYGFLLIFLSFNLTINGHRLDVLPDFVGYVLLIRGTRELEPESPLFGSARPFATGMMVYTAILWVGNLLAVTEDGWVSQLLGVISMVVSLYVSWLLIQGVREMEEARRTDLNSARLFSLWKGMLAAQVLGRVLALLVNLANVGILIGLLAVLGIVGFVLNLLYLMAWWKGTKAWEALPPRPTGPEIF